MLYFARDLEMKNKIVKLKSTIMELEVERNMIDLNQDLTKQNLNVVLSKVVGQVSDLTN